MKVVSAMYLSKYRIRVWFNCFKGEKNVDIEPILQSSANPSIKELLDVRKFRQFHIEHGGLCWDNNALSLSAESLYDGSYLNTT